MKRLFPLALFIPALLAICSCDERNDPELPDLTPPEFTYLQINGVDVTEDTVRLSREAAFNLRFNVNDNIKVMEGDFSLIINNLEGLSKTIDNGPGQSNYKFTYGLLNLETINHLKEVNSYTTEPNDQIKFKIHTIDPSNNITEKSIVVIVF